MHRFVTSLFSSLTSPWPGLLLVSAVLAAPACRADAPAPPAQQTGLPDAAELPETVDTATGPRWTFGGFGTVGAVHSNARGADFSSTVLKPNGAGASHDWSGNVDSRVGAQLGLNLDKRWSAVLQLVSEQRRDNSYAPVVEWANIQYKVTPDLSLRLGRIALPNYLAADYRKAAYALPWVRVPIELYNGVPISNSNGIDAIVRWHAGGMKQVTQVFFGGTNVKISDTAHAKARGLAGLSHTLEDGAFTLRGSMMRASVSVDLARPLFDAFRRFGPQGQALADRYDLDDKLVTAMSLGASYDPGHWFLMAEAGRVNSRSFLGDRSAMYVSAGYRYADLTPYLTVSQSRSHGATSVAGLTLAGPAPLQAAAGALNGALNGLLRRIAVQRTVSAGLRWDFRPNLALKTQYDRVLPQDGSSGTLVNVQPGFQSGRAVDVFSVSLDFVF